MNRYSAHLFHSITIPHHFATRPNTIRPYQTPNTNPSPSPPIKQKHQTSTMGLIKTGIKYGSLYAISKQALNTLDNKNQQNQHPSQQQQASSSRNFASWDTCYVHQQWCNGHCEGGCNGQQAAALMEGGQPPAYYSGPGNDRPVKQ